MKIGTNTFGLGAAFKRSFKGTLASLKEAGITSVEPCILFPANLLDRISAFVVREMPVTGGIFPSAYGAETIRTIRNQGLTVVSVHVMGLNRKLGKIDGLLRFCKENGIKYAVFSFMEESVATMRKMLPALSAAAKKFREEGMWLLIHNHAQEWKESEGTNVMEFLAENVPELGFELDAGWTEYAGVSSLEVIKRLGSRIRLLHLKEIQKGEVDLGKPFCVAPGTGILPLGDLLQATDALELDEDGILFDQDNSVTGDVLADIREGIRNVREISRGRSGCE